MALGAAGVGALLLWSSVRGVKVTSGLRDILAGHAPVNTNGEPIAGTPGTGQTGTGGTLPVGGPSSTTAKANKALGLTMCAAVGWVGAQWSAFDWIAMAESGWNEHAENASGAYGIPQALPGSKMASAGPDWKNNPATQIKWMIGYIRGRYGNPVKAKTFHEANGWY